MRMTSFIQRGSLIGMAAVCVLGIGCGGGDKTVQIKGVVQEKGAPVKVAKEKEQFSVLFAYQGKDGGAKNAAASVGDDGNFTLDNVPAGVNGRFVVRSVPYPPKGDVRERFGDAFGDAAKSPLSYTVTETSPQEIVIDLSDKKVKSK